MIHPNSFVLELPTGVQIRDPETARMVQSGETFPRSNFWNRLLESGQVREAKPAAAPAPVDADQPSEDPN